MKIRKASAEDLQTVLAVERAAFGQVEEADLVRDLLADPTAQPCLSLLAEDGDDPVGHVLFTAARIEGADKSVTAAIPAPLAVVPGAQGKGVGRALVENGLRRLAETGTALVFVLGDPAYYSRFGFEPATRLGFAAPYPLPDAYAEAWMVQALRDGVLGSVHGRIVCADALSRPELWQE